MILNTLLFMRIYTELLQNKYEGEYVKSIVNYMYDKGNKNRMYKSVRDISNVVMGKIDSYVLKVTLDKIEIENTIKSDYEKLSLIQIMKETQRECLKIIDSHFIYNI